MVLRAALRDLERAHDRPELAGTRPVPLARNAVEQAGAVLRAAARVARAIRDAFNPEGLSVYQANGKAAGQTVFHYHVHLVPRHEGDGMALSWPVKNPARDKLEAYAARIRASLPG